MCAQAERKQIAAESMGEAVLQEEVQLLSLGADYAVLGRPYIVMEKGQSLADCVQQHSQENRVQMLLVRAPQPQVLPPACRPVSAATAAHHNGNASNRSAPPPHPPTGLQEPWTRSGSIKHVFRRVGPIPRLRSGNADLAYQADGVTGMAPTA